MNWLETTIELKDENVFIKRYKIRATGRDGRTIETSIPREVFEREARRQGLTIEEALHKLVVVWRYNVHGIFLSFEQERKREVEGRENK